MIPVDGRILVTQYVRFETVSCLKYTCLEVVSQGLMDMLWDPNL